ncbi:unnamed protein product [Echinostoma caproni]|uniref:BZIP domain-containing protein n=1 Tax=Echinostoma caproni TaxID=27848 RepID=A0A183AEH7_9TREM|nr:unnamed protein product [Echinostoma caproni]
MMDWNRKEGGHLFEYIDAGKKVGSESDEVMQQLMELQQPDTKRGLMERELRARKQRKRQLRTRHKQLLKRIQVLQAIQGTIDRQYASLRDVCVEKRQRLEELLALNVVYEEIVDLEVSIPIDLGRNPLDHVSLFFMGSPLGTQIYCTIQLSSFSFHKSQGNNP